MNKYSLTDYRFNKIMEMLHIIAKREGIQNPKFDISKGSEKGDGYCGEKTRVALKGDNKSMELFIKGSPTDETFKNAFDSRPIYLLEIMFYNVVYPTFHKFQIEKNIPKPFTSVIECVDTCSDKGNELLILQNARSLGYELWDKMKQMNKEHVEFVFTEYGKYHGISFALKDQQPKTYQGLLNKLPVNALEFFEDKMFYGLRQMVEKGKELFDPKIEAEEYKVYSDFTDQLTPFWKRVTHYKDQYSVIVHGDCWSNNMMFKYATETDKSIPEKMYLLDFQIIGQTSPVLDLSNFLYSSSPKEIYDNLDYYLHIYHDSLCKTISDLGSDPKVLFPFEELKNQWKMFSKHGFIIAAMVLKICVQDKDETMDISEALEASDGADLMAGFTKAGRNDALYKQRFRSLINHMIVNKFI